MTRSICLLLVAGLAAAGCATPEVAEDYEAKTYLPQEIELALKSDDPARRADAANQVETMPAASRKAALLSLLTDERPHVRLLAVNLLVKHHASDADAVAGLANVLSLDADVDVRVAVVDALGKSGTKPGLAAIVTALSNDGSLVVKRQAAEVLDRITGQSHGGSLVTAIDTAEGAADDAMMSYEEWFEAHGSALRWDATQGRFVDGGGK